MASITMDKQRKQEYDFFMRLKGLCEREAMQGARFADDPGKAGDLFRQYLNDARNCELWAKQISQGWVMTHPPESQE